MEFTIATCIFYDYIVYIMFLYVVANTVHVYYIAYTLEVVEWIQYLKIGENRPAYNYSIE